MYLVKQLWFALICCIFQSSMDWRIGCCCVHCRPCRLMGKQKLSLWMMEKESSSFESGFLKSDFGMGCWVSVSPAWSFVSVHLGSCLDCILHSTAKSVSHYLAHEPKLNVRVFLVGTCLNWWFYTCQNWSRVKKPRFCS